MLFIYLIITPLQAYASVRQDHPICRLLASGLVFQLAALLCLLLHYSLFAANGTGVFPLALIGQVLEIVSQSMFMLLLLLLAMGWAVTRQELTCKVTLVTLWTIYVAVHFVLYIWMKVFLLINKRGLESAGVTFRNSYF